MSLPQPSVKNSHGLTAEEERAYREDGFVIRRSVFSEVELQKLRQAVESVVERAAAGGGRRYFVEGNRYVEWEHVTVQYEHAPDSRTVRVIEPFHHLHPQLDALVDDERMVAPMRGLVGSDSVALWTDKINLKRPREGSGFRWHQDSPYWSHVCDHTDRLLNVLVTLDDATLENGCFRVIRGSHRQGFLPGIQDGSELGPLFTDPGSFEENEQVAFEVPAGSQVFFAAHSVHGSQPNHSDRARRALVLTYQPGDSPMFKIPATRNAGQPRRSEVAV